MGLDDPGRVWTSVRVRTSYILMHTGVLLTGGSVFPTQPPGKAHRASLQESRLSQQCVAGVCVPFLPLATAPILNQLCGIHRELTVPSTRGK